MTIIGRAVILSQRWQLRLLRYIGPYQWLRIHLENRISLCRPSPIGYDCPPLSALKKLFRRDFKLENNDASF